MHNDGYRASNSSDDERRQELALLLDAGLAKMAASLNSFSPWVGICLLNRAHPLATATTICILMKNLAIIFHSGIDLPRWGKKKRSC